MVRLVTRLPHMLQTGIGSRRQQFRAFGHDLSQFIIPKTNGRSIRPLPLPAELNEPGVTALACNLDIPTRVKSIYVETSAAELMWFETKGVNAKKFLKTSLFKKEGGSTLVPLEYLGVDPSSGKFTFKRFKAPLATFASFVEAPSKNFNLYLAQCDFTSFPESLQEDLEFRPRFLRKYSSERHIYGRNIWMGVPPTYTPLHRDPNHNYFQQLAGSKMVRLMSPATGLKVYRKLFGENASNDLASDADPRGRIRNEEMMVSPQREALYRAVWENQDPDIEIFEGELSRGQSLFIPKGWWHSFKSEDDWAISASVNHWFQFDKQNVGALRELAARRHKCVQLMANIDKSSGSFHQHLLEIHRIELKEGLEPGSLLGEYLPHVQQADKDLRVAMVKWGYRGKQAVEFRNKVVQQYEERISRMTRSDRRRK